MAGSTITSIAFVPEEIAGPVFVGRENGTIEKYHSPDWAFSGKPAMTLFGHSKAVTCIVATSPEELYSCSMDGNIRQWSADPDQESLKRSLSVTKLPTPLRCLALSDSRIYTGGNDGSLFVIDGTRRSTWPGHQDALSCIAIGPEDASLVITGGYDNQIRLWDSKVGKTIRLLVGHSNHVKCLRVVAGDVLLSFARDLTMKIWRLPESGEDPEEEAPSTPADQNRQTTVSFKEPNRKKAQSGNIKTNENDEDNNKDYAENDTKDATVNSEAAVEGAASGADEGVSVAEIYRAGVERGGEVKSVLKARPEPPIRRLRPIGTIEIPEAPHVVAAAREDSAYCYVGTSGGYVLGINTRTLTNTVLNFVSHNTNRVRADGKEARLILRDATRAIRRRCRHAIQQRQRQLLRAARKVKAAKRAEERKERLAALAARRAERAAARAAKADEEDDEEDDEANEEDDEEPEEAEEEEDEEQENDEEGEEDPLAALDEVQREELAEFRRAQEKERDEEVNALRHAAESRRKTMQQLASTTYDTARERFFRLPFTSYKRLEGEAVLALAVDGSGCCAVQEDHIVRVDLTPGITYL